MLKLRQKSEMSSRKLPSNAVLMKCFSKLSVEDMISCSHVSSRWRDLVNQSERWWDEYNRILTECHWVDSVAVQMINQCYKHRMSLKEDGGLCNIELFAEAVQNLAKYYRKENSDELRYHNTYPPRNYCVLHFGSRELFERWYNIDLEESYRQLKIKRTSTSKYGVIHPFHEFFMEEFECDEQSSLKCVECFVYYIPPSSSFENVDEFQSNVRTALQLIGKRRESDAKLHLVMERPDPRDTSVTHSPEDMFHLLNLIPSDCESKEGQQLGQLLTDWHTDWRIVFPTDNDIPKNIAEMIICWLSRNRS